MALKTFTINFMGDTMLGRLIDQMFPEHVDEPDETHIVRSLLGSNLISHLYTPSTPWGNTLPLLHSADLNIVNLETSVTTHSTKWPNKVFNYRMHPANIVALTTARIGYVGLANNHTLDFCEEGLLETVRTVKSAGIAFAGAGESREEALRPAVLRLPSSQGKEHEIHIWAAVDHPQEWSETPTFHFIDYTPQTRAGLKRLLVPAKGEHSSTQPEQHSAALRIFSVHWGPNYSWQPAKDIRDLAHFLIDECNIDIIHGHSSHHVQGVEKYQGKLIIYGCGDFVDDYALVPGWRNNLSAVWRVDVEETKLEGEDEVRLSVRGLEVYPTIIEKFQARRMGVNEPDAAWVCQKVQELSGRLGTMVDIDERDGIVKLQFA